MDELKPNTPKIPENIPQTAIEVPRDVENNVPPQATSVVENEDNRIGLKAEITELSRQNVASVDEKGYIKVTQADGKVPNPDTLSADELLSRISK